MDVLFVEPDPDLASAYLFAIKEAGLKGLSARSGQQAITILDQQPVKLICLEVHLADHNGIEFLHELRSYPEWDKIKVALLTYIPEPDLQFSDSQHKQLGIVGYFYKPRVQLKELANYIKEEVS